MNEENNVVTETNEHVETPQVETVSQDIQDDRVDSLSMEAEVIGELKKEKIGKPTLVLEMLGIFLVVIIVLPIINNMLNDENSALYKFIYGSPVAPIVDPDAGSTTPNTEYLDGKELQLITSGIKVKYENIIFSDLYLKKNSLFATLTSYNGVVDLDDSQIYVEIYSKSQKLQAVIKLTGRLAAEEIKYELTNTGLLFNSSENYYMKVKEMNDGDFPTVTLSTDESGLGNLTCTKNNRVIEYTFKNNYLISIKDTENVLLADYTENEYLDLISKFRDKSTKLNTISTVEENETGFIFNADINLEQEGYVIPSSVKDNNYFALDKEAKYIKYEQAGKGFDCK